MDLITSGQVSRNKVLDIEAIMLTMPRVELEVKHHFAEGTYARELFIPKGTTLTGKVHKYSQVNIMTKGDMSVLVDGKIVRVQAPFVVVSPPGTKRIAYAHEDTIWITVHGTHETDLEKIEAEFIAQNEQEYLTFIAKTLPGDS